MKTIIKSFLKRGTELSLDFKIKQDITVISQPTNPALPSNSNSHFVEAEAAAAEMKWRAPRKQLDHEHNSRNHSVIIIL